MKIRLLFEKYQKYLLSFANTWYGRGYLELDKLGKINNNYRICKITPDGIHFHIERDIYQAVFFPRSPYLKKFRLALEGLEIANKLMGKVHNPEFVIPHFQGLTYVNWLPLLMRAEKTLYPDADPETTSVDGYVQFAGETAWATARGAENGNAAWPSHAGGEGFYSGPYLWIRAVTVYTKCFRCIFLFDTSSLGNRAIIESGNFKFTVDELAASPETADLEGCTPATNTNLVLADYSCMDDLDNPTEFATRQTLTASTQETFTLNSSGLSAVDPIGITKFMSRTARDIDNNPADSTHYGASIYFADNGSNIPELVVIYSIKTSPLPTFYNP